MNVYKTEEEQVEDLKRWAKSYGPSIILGILIALAITFGWKAWQHYQTKQAVAASTLFQAMVTKDGKADQTLLDKYPKSPYAAFASMVFAKDAIDNNQPKEAITHLQWVVDHSADENLIAIAQIRTARIQLGENDFEAALNTLGSVKNTGFLGLAQAVRGDVFFTQEKYAEAKAAYQEAINLIPNIDDVLPIVRIKIENIPLAPEQHERTDA